VEVLPVPEAALNVVLLRHTPEPEEVVAMAAKLCYSPSGVEELREKIERGRATTNSQSDY